MTESEIVTAIALIGAFAVIAFIAYLASRAERTQRQLARESTYTVKPVREAGCRVEARIKRGKDGDWYVTIGRYRHDRVFHAQFMNTGDGFKSEAQARGAIRLFFPDAMIFSDPGDEERRRSQQAAADAATTVSTLG